MTKKRNQSKRQTKKVRWSPIIASIITTFIWTMYLFYVERNDDQYVILQDSKQLLLIIAAVSISFAWKSAADEIAKRFPSVGWINYYVAIVALFAVLLLWLAAAIVWAILPNN